MSFKASLNLGALGECLYMEARKGELVRLDGRKGDFLFEQTGEKLELKTDLYPLAKTANFFIEKYSDMNTKSPGGPFQAQAHGAHWFTYFYVGDLTAFTFRTDLLVERINKLEPELERRQIRNASWVTEGLLVPRDSISDIATIEQFEIRKKVIE